jgi:hypothetical protein
MRIPSEMDLNALAIMEGQKRSFRSSVGVPSEETERNHLAMVALEVLDPPTVKNMYDIVCFLQEQCGPRRDEYGRKTLEPTILNSLSDIEQMRIDRSAYARTKPKEDRPNPDTCSSVVRLLRCDRTANAIIAA